MFLISYLHRELTGSHKVPGINRGSAWPIQGGLASITSTPLSHPPQQRTNPARNAFSDHLPNKTNMQIMQAADTNKSKTPSPQKLAVKIENISPTGAYKEESAKVAQISA